MALDKHITKYMDELSSNGEPFFFMFDFELEQPVVHRLAELPTDIYSNLLPQKDISKVEIEKYQYFDAYPISREQYAPAFREVKEALQYGNSFLLNLSFPHKVLTDASLTQLYSRSMEPYSLLYKDDFLVQSPECFVKIKGNKILTYPMKGTIDASIPNAKSIILKDEKELAEHYTIVDLLRNDLSMVADKVKVDRFRYIDELTTHKGKLLQVSSEITGTIKPALQNKIGSILSAMLPAGSISGAPKPKTIELIKKIEGEKRGYYTGVFGVFDGINLDSGVMIRFLRKQDDHYIYHSGGGITFMSNLEEEYQEIIQKIYAPASRVHTDHTREDTTTISA